MAAANDLETPVLLLAMPQVDDPYFHRTVVLLLRHQEEGSFGFIVNRPTRTSLVDVIEDLGIREWTGDPDAHAFFGGPVQPQLGSVVFVPEDDEDLAGEGTSEVIPGLGMTHHIGDLERLAARAPGRIRLYLGYAAWGEGQLLQEILRNDWLIAPVDPELLFAREPDSVWSQAVRSAGVDPSSLPSWTIGDATGAN